MIKVTHICNHENWKEKLGYYKENNKNLQFEMSKQIILHKLIELENYHSKDQNKKLEKLLKISRYCY